jgi:hypothetical protein
MILNFGDRNSTYALSALLLLLSACGDEEGQSSPGIPVVPAPTPAPTSTPSPAPTQSPALPAAMAIDFDFAEDQGGWFADYVDYQNGQEPSIAFTGEVVPLPSELGNRRGFRLSSINRPDDVYMFITYPTTGLAPNQAYRIDTSIDFGTNAPADCTGAGGGTGRSVYVKAGASSEIPSRILMNGSLRSNYDKGRQENSGEDVRILGDFAQTQPGGPCTSDGPYQLKTLTSRNNGPVVRADGRGRLWLLIGTDSGYEGLTTIFYLKGKVTLTPVPG